MVGIVVVEVWGCKIWRFGDLKVWRFEDGEMC